MTRRSTVRALRRAAGVLAAAVAVAGVLAGGAAPGADEPVVEAAPESQRVLLVSDSVGLGTRGYFADAFPAGWETNVIGTPAYFVEMLEERHVEPTLWGAPWMVGDHVVIAGGYNYPYWDPARFDRSIDSMVNTLTAAGVEHVYWVTLREVKPQFISASAWRQVQPYYWYFPTVNEHLERALERHPELSLVDWAAAADRPGITYDAIHLNATGARLYSSLVADAVFAAEDRPADGSVTRVHVTDDPDVEAVAVNLTATKTRTRGYFTAFACGSDVPTASNLNYGRDDVSAGAAIVPVDAQGDICVFNSTSAHVVVDLFGAFDGAVGLTAGPPTRLWDSRPGDLERSGSTRVVHATDEPGAAVALGVTALNATGRGYVTGHPCGVEPTTATVNFDPGAVTPNVVIVEADEQGDVCISVRDADTDVLVDRLATFTAADGVRPGEPERVVDSRGDGVAPVAGDVLRVPFTDLLDPTSGDGTGGTGTGDGSSTGGDGAGSDGTGEGSSTGSDGTGSDGTGDGSSTGGDGAGGNGDGNGASPAVSAVLLNVGVVAPQAQGYATVYPCDAGDSGTSNVNFGPFTNVSNFVVVTPDADGEVCVRTTAAAEITVDLLGVTRDGFTPVGPRRAHDSRR